MPPSMLATALVLQTYDGVSDDEATARAAFDLRWKVATHCPVGPIIDTDRAWQDRRISLRIDGETPQDDNTSSMLFGPRVLVSWISKHVAMKPGDLIMSGTPGGVECHILHYGETVEVEIVGILRNRVTRVDTAAVTLVISLDKWLPK